LLRNISYYNEKGGQEIMAKGKYAKQVVKMYLEPEFSGYFHKEFEGKVTQRAMQFDRSVYELATMRIEYQIIYGGGTGYSLGTSWEKKLPQITIKDLPNIHSCDEIFIFQGTNPQDQHELGGVVEFWLGEGNDAEKYMITEPTVVYVPAGLVHSPIYFRKVDRPFLMTVIYTAAKWTTEFFPMPPAFKR
jgi:hypothetical protein